MSFALNLPVYFLFAAILYKICKGDEAGKFYALALGTLLFPMAGTIIAKPTVAPNHAFIYAYLFIDESNKIITTPKAYLKTSLAGSYEHCHNSSDLRIIHDIVRDDYPEFLSTFNEVYLGKNFFYDCNMFDHMPSNSRTQPLTSTLVCSAIRPVRPLCDSRMRTIGFAAIRRRKEESLACGVVPSDSISFLRPVEVMPFV